MSFREQPDIADRPSINANADDVGYAPPPPNDPDDGDERAECWLCEGPFEFGRSLEFRLCQKCVDDTGLCAMCSGTGSVGCMREHEGRGVFLDGTCSRCKGEGIEPGRALRDTDR